MYVGEIVPRGYPAPQRLENNSKVQATTEMLKAQRLNLLYEYNSLTPIGQLPHVILSEIFLHITRSQPLFNVSIDGEQTGWIAFTHVCRHFRTLALSNPLLWTFLDFTHPSFTMEMLRRSGQAHLDIFALTRSSIYDEVKMEERWRMVAKLMRTPCISARLRKLHLQPPLLLDTIRKLRATVQKMCAPAPFLESLNLSGGSIFRQRGIVLELPEQFLGGQAPRLSELILRRCHLTWAPPPPVLRNITFLQIDLRHCPEVYSLPTVAQLIEFLSYLLKLERLELLNVFPTSCKNASTVVSDTLFLPRLRHLRLCSRVCAYYHVDLCSVFLQYLSFPPSATVDLETYPK
ncbi:hypothetical protein L218DRAFT_1077460 [Marasmius fiardii PR-910]|nr:hypothetical protein L218DRAFT_1077460 [Marasmius fiardii PR-910]